MSAETPPAPSVHEFESSGHAPSNSEVTWAVGNDSDGGEAVDAEVVKDLVLYNAEAAAETNASPQHETGVLDAELVTPESEKRVAAEHKHEDATLLRRHKQEEAELRRQYRKQGVAAAVSGLLSKDWSVGSSFRKGRETSRVAHETPEPSVSPELVISPEDYRDATRILRTTLTNIKEGPFPNVSAVKMLETALANVAARNKDSKQVIEDIFQIERDVEKQAVEAFASGREPTFNDVKNAQNAAYQEALARGDMQEAQDILRRKGLTWILSHRGSVDLTTLFS